MLSAILIKIKPVLCPTTPLPQIWHAFKEKKKKTETKNKINH